MKTGSITYNGKNSLTDLGIFVTGSGSFDAAELDVDRYEVAGRNGDVIIPKNRYKNISISYPAFIPKGFDGKVQSVRNWLRSAKTYARLEDTYDMDHFREALATGIQSFEPVNQNDAANFAVTFDCKPQRFLKTGETETKVAVAHTYNGSLVTFDTPVATSMDKAEVALVADQPLNGQAYPWTAGGGKNKWEFGDVAINGTYQSLQMAKPLPAGTYTISTIWSTTSPSAAPQFRFRKSDASALISVTLSSSVDGRRYTTFTLSEAAYYVYVYSATGSSGYTATITDTQIEAGSSMTSFVPYANICPISGHTEAKLWVASSYDPTIPATVSVELSKNKFTDFFTIGKNISGGTVVDRPANDRCATVDGCAVLAETQYTISFSGGGSVGVYYYDSTDTFLSQETGWNAAPFTFTTPQNTARVRFSYNTGTPPTDVQLELGATATTYTAAIIYAGTYDFVTGKLKLTWKGVRGSDVMWEWFTHASGDVPYFDPADKKKGQHNYYCSAYEVVGGNWQTMTSGQTAETASLVRIVVRDSRFTDLATAKTLLANVQFVYELATPLEFTLTPQQVQTLAGENNVWSDGGDISVEFSAPFGITNPTEEEARPLFRLVNPQQNDVISLNGKTITVSTSYTGEMFIDCETMDAFSSSGTNLNSYITAPDFPVLKEGLNIVTFSGSGDIYITPRWWEL